MRYFNHLQIVIAAFIILIQAYKQKRNIIHKKWAPIKVILNFLIFKIYLINILSDLTIIENYIHFRSQHSETSILLLQLEATLFELSFFVFFVLLYIIIFMRNFEKNDLARIYSISKLIQIILFSLLQTLLIQIPITMLSALQQFAGPTDQKKLIQISYTRLLLFLSSISSMDPILKILVYNPLENFQKAYNVISTPKIQNLHYEYVQLKNNEFFDAFSNEQNEQDNILSFDSDEQYQEKMDSEKPSWFKVILNYFWFLYYSIQLVFTFVVILAFVCIALQMIYPAADIVSSLNMINMCQGSVEVKMPRIVEASVVFIFKILFIVLMYFSSQNQISFTTSNKLMDNIQSLVVLVRKSLLNFSLIGLLTTLYPNLTFTLNNSDCYKSIAFRRGEFINSDAQCPASIISLITMRIFDSNISFFCGLAVLLLYTFYSIYLIIKIFRQR